ncbi:MAG: argininosuccinate lyase [Chloroflexota bacterium]
MSGKTKLQSAAFIVSPTQVVLDTAMLEDDIWGTQAHVLMLQSAGVISAPVAVRICRALDEIKSAARSGEFKIDRERGAQLSLERAVIDRVGTEDGSRMHTARSRNDQVMVTEMLHLRGRALALASEACKLVGVLLDIAVEHVNTVMPGYTHMQPAKPTTFGQWALAYADALLRGMVDLAHTWKEYDMCPLGAVESYGTSWPIDRELTAHLLGFARVWEVPQDAIASRGMPQLAYMDVCKRLALTASKLGADLLLFTTWEYGYVQLGEAVAQRLHPITGSSVMAQKKNPDALELVRATAHEVVGLAGMAAHLLAGLPMGYNRDTREVKEWSALCFDKTLAALSTLSVTLATLSVEREKMLKAVDANYSSTTDLADTVAQLTGVGYRQVYAIIGRLVDRLIEAERPLHSLTAAAIVEAASQVDVAISLTDEQVQVALDPAQAVSRRKHIGGAAPDRMESMIAVRRETLAKHLGWLETRQVAIDAAQADTALRIRQLGTV